MKIVITKASCDLCGVEEESRKTGAFSAHDSLPDKWVQLWVFPERSGATILDICHKCYKKRVGDFLESLYASRKKG